MKFSLSYERLKLIKSPTIGLGLPAFELNQTPPFTALYFFIVGNASATVDAPKANWKDSIWQSLHQISVANHRDDRVSNFGSNHQ